MAALNPASNAVMGIFDHLNVLRRHIMRAVAALILTTALSFVFGDHLLNFLLLPIGGAANVQSIEVAETFGVYMRVSLLGGFILAFPVMVFEALAFIAPGLERREQKWALVALPLASLLFAAGVAFAFYVMLPAALPFLVGFLGINTMPRLSNYVDFISNLIFWIGMSFELPLAVFFLAKVGLVRASLLLRQWRFAFLIIAVAAAMITPTVDPINMAILMAPLVVLYGLSIFLAYLARK